MLTDTKLSTLIEPNMLWKIERLGEKISIGPHETLFRKGDESWCINITLEGDIYVGDKPNSIWIGPGDILGEIGFLLDTPRTATARAGAKGCTLWRTHKIFLGDDSLTELVILITHFLLGLAPYIHLRLMNVSSRCESDPDICESHCDHQNPAILNVARFLKGRDDWETAVNVWEFVRHMPYRFGFWNVPASRTLELGFGMCTTKANLQVALLRALNIEARFGECEVAAKYLVPFLPPAYRGSITKDIRHYFGIVFLDGKPYRADASFTRAAVQILAEAHPQYALLLYDGFKKGFEFAIEAERETIEYRMFDNLAHVMNKRPFFNSENAEALNLYLDRRQGSIRPIPQWVESTQRLLSYNPKAARLKAIAGLISDATKLYQSIHKNEI